MTFLNIVIILMVLALCLPLYQAWKEEDIWQTMLALSSVSGKSALIVLIVSVARDDWMMGVVGIIVLSVGNAGFMLLANILKRLEEV